MNGTYLRVAPVVAVVALLLFAGPVAAESVPEGVVADAVVTVTVKSVADDAAVAAALVQLEARLGDDVLAAWYGPSAEDGTITFTDVWRPDVAGPALEWHAVAYWSHSSYGADAGLPANCRVTASIYGTASSVAATGSAAMTINGEPASSAVCGPSVAGSVVDSSGQPFEVASAYVSATDEEGHVWEIPFAVDASGAFTAPAPPVHELSFFVRGAGARTVDEAGCSYTYSLIASQAVVVDAEVPVALVAKEERILGSCTATPEPTQVSAPSVEPQPQPTQVSAPSVEPQLTPGGGAVPLATPPFTGGRGPALTPPNTDVAATATPGAAPIGIPLALLAATTALILVFVPRRGLVREVRQRQ